MVDRKSISLLHKYEAEIRRLQTQLAYEKTQHARDLEVATKAANDLIQRFTRLNFYQEAGKSDIFSVHVEFPARFLGGAQRNEMEYLAGYVGHLVEAEIATCRFMQSVYDNYRREIDERIFCGRGGRVPTRPQQARPHADKA